MHVCLHKLCRLCSLQYVYSFTELGKQFLRSVYIWSDRPKVECTFFLHLVTCQFPPEYHTRRKAFCIQFAYMSSQIPLVGVCHCDWQGRARVCHPSHPENTANLGPFAPSCGWMWHCWDSNLCFLDNMVKKHNFCKPTDTTDLLQCSNIMPRARIDLCIFDMLLLHLLTCFWGEAAFLGKSLEVLSLGIELITGGKKSMVLF